MATSIAPLLTVFLLAATASARPCKKFFYFSATTATTTTYYPFNSYHQNPNPNPLLHSQNPRYLALIFTTTSRLPFRRPSLDLYSVKQLDEDSRSSDLPFKFYSAVSRSIRDRSRDIMNVAAALAAMLLGVGCGAFTAAAVYFVYVLLSRRRVDLGDVDSISSDDDYADDDIAIAKKLGYVAIPPMPKLVDDDFKNPAPPAKEVV